MEVKDKLVTLEDQKIAFDNLNGKISTLSTQVSTNTSAISTLNSNLTNKGSSNQPVYMNSNGIPTSISYTINKSVPSDAKFTDTNTWRGIQNNLTSTSTSDSLSAYQGKVLSDNINRIGSWGIAETAGITTTFYNNARSDVNFIWLSKNQKSGAFMIVMDGIFGTVNFAANTSYKIFNLTASTNTFAIYSATFMLAQTNAWTDTIFNIYHNANVVKSQDFYVRPTTVCWNVAGCLVMNGYIW